MRTPGVWLIFHGPLALPAVVGANSGLTPRLMSSALRRRYTFPCFHWRQRSRWRLQLSKSRRTAGVWQKPKEPSHPRRYVDKRRMTCVRLRPGFRLVRACTRALNRPSVSGAILRRLGRFPPVKRNPKKLRFQGWSTALVALLTRSFRRCGMKRLIRAITRAPARALRP